MGGVSKAEEFTVTIKCNNKIHDGLDCGATLTLTFKVTPDKHDPTCTEQGYTLYTLAKEAAEVKAAAEAVAVAQKVTLCDKDTYPEVNKEANEQCEQRVDGDPATGHTWVIDTSVDTADGKADGITWEVAEESGSATLHLTCSVCHKQTLEVTFDDVTGTTDSAEDCREHDITTYTLDKTVEDVTEAVTKAMSDSLKGHLDGEFAAINATHQVEGAQGPHSWDGVWHEVDATHHAHQCTLCEEYDTDGQQAHSYTDHYNYVEGTTTHKGVCVCGRVSTSASNCSSGSYNTAKGGICTNCKHNYTKTVKVYYHNTSSWSNVSVYAFYQTTSIAGSTKNFTTPIGSWPGEACEGNDGDWYYKNVSFNERYYAWVIFTDGKPSNTQQTKNILVEYDQEMYVSNKGVGFATKAEAEANEKDSKPYHYTFYFYNINGWSSVKIHLWDPNDSPNPWSGVWGTAVMTPVEEGSKWCTWTYERTTAVDQWKFGVIFFDGEDGHNNRTYWNDNDSKIEPEMTKTMYFVGLLGDGYKPATTQYYIDVPTSHPMNTAKLSTVSVKENTLTQVATLPPQLSKSYLAPALAA